MTFIAGLIFGCGLVLIVDLRAHARIAKIEASIEAFFDELAPKS